MEETEFEVICDPLMTPLVKGWVKVKALENFFFFFFGNTFCMDDFL